MVLHGRNLCPHPDCRGLSSSGVWHRLAGKTRRSTFDGYRPNSWAHGCDARPFQRLQEHILRAHRCAGCLPTPSASPATKPSAMSISPRPSCDDDGEHGDWTDHSCDSPISEGGSIPSNRHPPALPPSYKGVTKRGSAWIRFVLSFFLFQRLFLPSSLSIFRSFCSTAPFSFEAAFFPVLWGSMATPRLRCSLPGSMHHMHGWDRTINNT